MNPSWIESPSNAAYNTQYECPSIFAKDGSLKPDKLIHTELQVWLRNSLQEGREFLHSQRAYSSISKAIDIICREWNANINISSLSLSDVWANNTKRNIKEICCILSNIRPSWKYEANSAKDATWQEQARIQNGLSDDWYNESNVDLTLKKLIELGTVEGTGYISPVWNPDLNNHQGGIELKLYRFDEVLPIQLGKDFDLQRAYAVILVDEMPINRARRIFPHKRHLLVADRGETRMAKDTILSAARGVIKGALDYIRDADSNRGRTKTYPSPVVDVLYTYVDDYSINPNNFEVHMGEASWKYTVPYIGQLIPTGSFNQDGTPKTKKATTNDCRMYPNRRLIISTKTCILYDGPSYWWHGKVPIVKYSPDEWVFSYLGFSMASEVYSLDKSSNRMRRDIEDALHLKIDSPLAIDEMAMGKTQAESSTIRKPGTRMRIKLAMGEGVKPILPPESYNVGTDHFLFVEKTEDKAKEILGVPDMRNLMQARQIPNSDTISQFFSQAGSVVTSMSRSLDPVMKFIADCNRYYFYQFYDIERRIKILGSDGLSKVDFDFNPATLIPQTLPNEPLNDNGIVDSTRFERAKYHLGNFRTYIEATSLHQITQMQRKLLLMQATKLIPGYPMIDPETLARELDISGWGHLEGDTIQEKVESFMRFMLDFQLLGEAKSMELQMKAQAMMQANSPEGQMQSALNNAASAANGNGKVIKGSVGHPPSYQEAPQLSSKSDGSSTIET